MKMAKRFSLKFWSRVNRNGPIHPTHGQCWDWSGPITKFGYARIRFNGRLTMCHRISWQLSRGPIPDNLRVLHKCDRRSCVNPDHLFLGTQADNIADMFIKGRDRQANRIGEMNTQARITESDVLYIRRNYRKRPSNKRHLAAMFGISVYHVAAIVHRQKWKHI